MKAGWQIVALEEVCEFLDRRGVTPEKLGSQFFSDGFRVISAKNIKGRSIDIAAGEQRFVNEPTYKRWMTSSLLADDVILTSEAPLGEPAYLEQDLKWCLGQRLFGVRSNKSKLFGRFLFYAFQASPVRDDMLSRATGATAQGIRQSELRKVKLPLPPLPEQQRIVAILDKAFEAIAAARANAEQNRQNARALFDSHLQSVFSLRGEGWIDSRLGEIAEVQSGGTPTVSQKDFWGGDIPWYSSGELNHTFTSVPERHITADGLEHSNAKLFPKGSLLVGMYDTAALKMSILDRDGAFNQAIAGIKPNHRIDVEFILHAINAAKPKLLLERRGVRQKNLSLGKIKDISIPLPTLEIQRSILVRIRKLAYETQRLQYLYQRKIAALDELKQSLLQQAFSGQL